MPEDLLPPSEGVRLRSTARSLAVHLHPDARHHLPALRRELTAQTQQVADDLLLVDLEDADDVFSVLELAAEVGAPDRDHLRGAILQTPGRWSRHGLLGPGPSKARQSVRSQNWGQVDQLGELPPALPVPPSARTWWVATAALAVFSFLITRASLAPLIPPVDHPREVAFTPARGGVWTQFDVDDGAFVSLIRDDGELEVVLHSGVAADKARFAVGDGTYRLHTTGQGILVVSTSEPIDRLASWVTEARESPAPLHSLAALVDQNHPRADTRKFDQ